MKKKQTRKPASKSKSRPAPRRSVSGLKDETVDISALKNVQVFGVNGSRDDYEEVTMPEDDTRGLFEEGFRYRPEPKVIENRPMSVTFEEDEEE